MPATRSVRAKGTDNTSSTILLEESFAPEFKEDMEEAPPKRFVVATGTKRTHDALEKENLHQIIFQPCNSEEDDSDADSKKWIEHNTKNSGEKRIHYLKLDLANAKLEAQELKEKVERLQLIEDVLTNFEKSIGIIESNIQQYKTLYVRAEGGAQFANLIRDEITQIKPKPTMIIPKKVIPVHVEKILELRFETYLKTEEERRIEFHNKIQYEQSKKSLMWIGKIVVYIIQILLVFLITKYLVNVIIPTKRR